MCGGTAGATLRRLAARGLSPRVRGNQVQKARSATSIGSIPACAGEPGACCGRWTAMRVYPRVCGGTFGDETPIEPAAGLSPRVRGNLRVFLVGPAVVGSIPACAGEPPTGSSWRWLARVYPRVCGGTICGAEPITVTSGLSPRVRGNRPLDRLGVWRIGSIPACAGEPCPEPAAFQTGRVYPRVCGGTPHVTDVVQQLQGLSPRVRGNRRRSWTRRQRAGSIPACAGEPGRPGWGRSCPRVYPRVCGGTSRVYRVLLGVAGLSPRVRGNQLDDRPVILLSGSIPACAGEP